MQDSQNFLGICPNIPLGRAYTTCQTPQLLHGFSPCYALQKTTTPKKLLDTTLEVVPQTCSTGGWCSASVLQIFLGGHPCVDVISIKWNNFVQIKLPHGCTPVGLLHLCRASFLENISFEGLLLNTDNFIKNF